MPSQNTKVHYRIHNSPTPVSLPDSDGTNPQPHTLLKTSFHINLQYYDARYGL